MTDDPNVIALTAIFKEFLPSLGAALSEQSGKVRNLPMTQGTATIEQIYKSTGDIVVHIVRISDNAVAPIHRHGTMELLFALDGEFFARVDGRSVKTIERHEFLYLRPYEEHLIYVKRSMKMLAVLIPDDGELNFDWSE